MNILVADDDLDNRTIAKDVLEAAGYHILLATNGLEVLDIVSKEKIDLIVLDLAMPKMNGWQTSKHIRESLHMTEIPILAFTAHALAGEDLKAKAAGCNDYISKPCLPSVMAKKVEAWLKISKERSRNDGDESL